MAQGVPAEAARSSAAPPRPRPRRPESPRRASRRGCRPRAPARSAPRASSRWGPGTAPSTFPRPTLSSQHLEVPLQLLLRHAQRLQPALLALHHVLFCLSQEVLVLELPHGLIEIARHLVQLALQPLALGLHVDQPLEREKD